MLTSNSALRNVGALDTIYHEEVSWGLASHYDHKFLHFESKYRARLSDVRPIVYIRGIRFRNTRTCGHSVRQAPSPQTETSSFSLTANKFLYINSLV